MQYQHGGSRSRMPPFARGGGGNYGRGPKQFYPPPPPPPPLPAAALPPPPPLNKYEVLLEAGRLAAEYLVAKGVLPPGSLQQRGGAVDAGGWGQLPPPPPLPEAPTYYNARSGRRQVDDECGTRNARSRRNRGGDYSSSNSSNYNGRWKRKFGADNRYSDSGRDRGRSRGYSDARSYDEDDEDGAPGFKRERRSCGGIDEVGSSVSGVAGEGPSSKVEAMGESKLEDTGPKASSNSNVWQKADALHEVEDENEANKMQEDSVVSNSEVVEQTLNCEGNDNNDSSGVLQEAETKHLPVSSGEKVSDGRPEDSGILSEMVEDDKTLHEKAEDDTTSDEVSIMENNLPNDPRNLLNYCSFARVPTRPRSVLANRNTRPAQREFPVSGQVSLVTTEEMSQTTMDGEANSNSMTSIQEDSKDEVVRQEHAEQSTSCNHVAESLTLNEKGTLGETEEMEEQKNIPQHYAVKDNKEPTELSPSFASHQNSFSLQVEKGIQIYNLDTPPQDEVLIDPPDKGKTVDSELLPNIKEEAAATMEEEKRGQSSSFKICDLNLVGCPEVANMRADPRLGQSSTAGCSVEQQDTQQVDFGTTLGDNSSSTDTFLLGNKAVQVIDIQDDPPVEADACDTSKAKGEMVYSSVENMTNPSTDTDALHVIQDGYGLAISDYLGADMPCYQSIQTDLQAGMDLNGSEGITVMDDPIYSSLSDIGFMEVWDQQPQDYEKFF
ncbi:hypothetical protein PAHAL_7G150700 [Panicum hallii]|uniref:Uncharacterized protein n=2 Tax=Panicum hallii TaxID=206008 RepID=A0A2S3I6R0_9POAL|nr:uncharacterized protein At4g26450-like isoform X2 [Panicum hallii]XP_025824560.1 uncharacterized protein At4g26450-like isoform X2 [Panicum hallii]PAN38151.1 hypothetical protein PAHAL_7G150700 [Panicum hallii]